MLGPVASQDPQRPIIVKKHVAGAREQKLALGQSDQNEQSKDKDAEEDVNAERNSPERSGLTRKVHLAQAAADGDRCSLSVASLLFSISSKSKSPVSSYDAKGRV